MKNSEWIALAHLYYYHTVDATNVEIEILNKILCQGQKTIERAAAIRGITREHIRLNVLRLPE